METWCDWERREGGEVSPQPDHRTIAENCSPQRAENSSPHKGGEQFSAVLQRTFSALLRRIPEDTWTEEEEDDDRRED